MSLHSEAAALLLVWAANLIKMYACTKKLGELDLSIGNSSGAQQQHLNLDDVQKISARTKQQMKREADGKYF